jgi:hypothetical protein
MCLSWSSTAEHVSGVRENITKLMYKIDKKPQGDEAGPSSRKEEKAPASGELSKDTPKLGEPVHAPASVTDEAGPAPDAGEETTK